MAYSPINVADPGAQLARQLKIRDRLPLVMSHEISPVVVLDLERTLSAPTREDFLFVTTGIGSSWAIYAPTQDVNVREIRVGQNVAARARFRIIRDAGFGTVGTFGGVAASLDRQLTAQPISFIAGDNTGAPPTPPMIEFSGAYLQAGVMSVLDYSDNPIFLRGDRQFLGDYLLILGGIGDLLVTIVADSPQIVPPGR